MELIPAKTILSPYMEGGWYRSNYNMNLYKGCSHGCIYCDSRSECYQVKDFDRVRGKADALEILERELYSKRKKGTVITGAMSDPYNPCEAKAKLTRGALELLDRYQFGIAIDTKSHLVLRDLDLLERISHHSPVNVNFTVTTADDTLCRKIERTVSPSSRRIKALGELRAAGIGGGVLLMPILPFINDTTENIGGVVEMAAAANARWVFVYHSFGVTLRANQREHYYNWLEQLFPGLKEKYIRTYRNVYNCTSPNSKELYQYFLGLCQKYQLPHSMKQINQLLEKEEKKKECVQLSLFDL